MTLFAFGAVSPWLAMVDHDKYGRFVDTVQSLDITTIAACHTPVIEGPFIQQAFDRIREFPLGRAAAAARPVDPRPDHRRHRPTDRLSVTISGGVERCGARAAPRSPRLARRE